MKHSFIEKQTQPKNMIIAKSFFTPKVFFFCLFIDVFDLADAAKKGTQCLSFTGLEKWVTVLHFL